MLKSVRRGQNGYVRNATADERRGSVEFPRFPLSAPHFDSKGPAMREVGPNGLDLIRNREGTVYHVYADDKGLPTGGTGHLIRMADHMSVGDPVSPELEQRWLKTDLAEAVACVNRHAPDLTQNQFDALVCFTFQEGCLRLQNMLADAGNLATVPEQMQHYTRSGNAHPRGTRIRRLLEADLFRQPDDIPLAPNWLHIHDNIT